ncbi:hypothetical protein CCACVL1_18992 [Corchorus capsularis]|uniref:Uncharacterized protein n=1 Tax=Corchorus capsularis TaxID=210143 RepID=A0A1R3HJ15_COCAP|nr:hypothetical protein CCACVL1_18992 [Corchorus capsularis]
MECRCMALGALLPNQVPLKVTPLHQKAPKAPLLPSPFHSPHKPKQGAQKQGKETEKP